MCCLGWQSIKVLKLRPNLRLRLMEIYGSIKLKKSVNDEDDNAACQIKV